MLEHSYLKRQMKDHHEHGAKDLRKTIMRWATQKKTNIHPCIFDEPKEAVLLEIGVEVKNLAEQPKKKVVRCIQPVPTMAKQTVSRGLYRAERELELAIAKSAAWDITRKRAECGPSAAPVTTHFFYIHH